MKRRNRLMRFLTLLMSCGILASLSALPALAYTGSGEDTAEESADESTIISEEITEETGTDDGNAFSVEGNGTLTDEADSSQNKLFYIVTTANGNSYYIIIDKDSSSNNVYMLSQIDEADLADFIEETGTAEEESATAGSVTDAESGSDLSDDTLEEPAQETDTGSTSPETETEDPDSGDSSGRYAGYVLLALACIGAIAAYYFLKVRNRDDQEDEDETAYGDDEQPDDIHDSGYDEADEDEEPEDDDENDGEPSADPGDTPDEGNVPFVDYPDPEEDNGDNP